MQISKKQRISRRERDAKRSNENAAHVLARLIHNRLRSTNRSTFGTRRALPEIPGGPAAVILEPDVIMICVTPPCNWVTCYLALASELPGIRRVATIKSESELRPRRTWRDSFDPAWIRPGSQRSRSSIEPPPFAEIKSLGKVNEESEARRNGFSILAGKSGRGRTTKLRALSQVVQPTLCLACQLVHVVTGPAPLGNTPHDSTIV